MTKKTIAIVCNDIDVGGVETALINMLCAIDVTQYDITLFTNTEKNACLLQIPKEIQIVSLEQFSIRNRFLNELGNGKITVAASYLYEYVCLRLTKSEFKKVKLSYGRELLSDKYFDCAIAYKQNVAMVATLYGIRARKKVVWVHGDLLGGNSPEQEYLNCFSEFDKIFCVSEAVKKNVLRHMPYVAERVQIFYNLLNVKKIKMSAEAVCNIQTEKGEHCLVTVGRLGHEKGQEMIPETVRLLTDAGYQVKWYIVGDGTLRDSIEQKCKEFKVTEQVIFTGTQSNPYPYIKNCDIYVQTSYSEGWCLTTQEAKILRKPVVTTDLPVMNEQFMHMENGYIVSGVSSQALFEGIKTLLDNPKLCQKFAEQLNGEIHDNSGELEKLYNYIAI